jgi:acetyltransferase-like isoleucine patch superfamily enzyme
MTNLLKRISTWFFARKCGHFGKNSVILPFYSPFIGVNLKNVYIGDNVTIGLFTCIAPIEHYNNKRYSPRISIGNGTSIDRYFTLVANNCVIIEKNVLIAFRVFITDFTHDYSNINVPILYQMITDGKPVLIKEGAYIGCNSSILPGVTIGRNSVIGANSVVTKDVPDYCVAVGNPAKVIKRYNFDKNKWIS